MKKKFIIEKIKWEWAKSVTRKEVYRDYELIRSATKKDALDDIKFLMSKPNGLTYTITVFINNEYLTYFLDQMPCFGGLVKYRDTHGETFHFNSYFPRDIRVAFPEGDIIYIACYRQNMKKDLNNPYYDFLLSPESPWISAFNSRDSIIFEDNYFVLSDMESDPTVFYSLMRLGGFTGGGYDMGLVNKDWHPKATLLLNKTGSADPRRLAGQKPIRISGGNWSEGFGYTRPFNESIFKTELPQKFENFQKLKGYPQAPYTNAYFVSVMKEKFNANLSVRNQKLNDILVDAWIYFKEESKNLGSGFPK